jgi:hypothetical protein
MKKQYEKAVPPKKYETRETEKEKVAKDERKTKGK